MLAYFAAEIARVSVVVLLLTLARILWKMGTVLTPKLVSLGYLGLSGLMTIPIWFPCLALDNLVRLHFKLARDSDIARNGISQKEISND